VLAEYRICAPVQCGDDLTANQLDESRFRAQMPKRGRGFSRIRFALQASTIKTHLEKSSVGKPADLDPRVKLERSDGESIGQIPIPRTNAKKGTWIFEQSICDASQRNKGAFRKI
jgi:hypothetical protein